MLLLKICASALMVITITGVAERISPRFAGVLLGFPLGVGLSLFFIGLEQGAVFAAGGALWSIQGIVASLMFCLGYRFMAILLRQNSRWGIPVSVLFGLFAFFSSALALKNMHTQSMGSRLVIVCIILVITAILFRIGTPARQLTKIRVTPLMIGCRAVTAALIIVLITETAQSVGPQWSGLFSAFPTTILPAVVILHYHYGSSAVPTLFRELPQGMPAIIVFACAVHLSYPFAGVYLGTLFSYTAATCYLLFYERILRNHINRKLDHGLFAVQRLFSKHH